MIAGPLRAARSRRLRSAAREQSAFYDRDRDPAEIAAWQLAAFNTTWERVARRVPYYRRLSVRERLPRRFSSWAEVSRIPPLTRGDLQRCGSDLYGARSGAHGWRSTGGTTAEPIRVPVWRSEARLAARDQWLARGWLGIRPEDRLFLLWGHSHQLGEVLQGRLGRWRRAILDRLLDYHRVSAYDLGDAAMARAADELLRARPGYVLGYSAALDRLARVNRDRREAFHSLRLKGVIATAEAFPAPDSAELIGNTFGCPVAMEYGSVETGPVAHQDDRGRFRVFWRHFRVELGPPHPGAPGRPLLITALYPRCLPLIRYDTGDLAIADDGPAITGLRRVVGRSNDFVLLGDGTRIHSEAFSHALKESGIITAFQAVQDADGAITVHYIPNERHSRADLEPVRRRLRRIHPGLRATFIAADALEKTVAGKTKRVVRDPAWRPAERSDPEPGPEPGSEGGIGS